MILTILILSWIACWILTCWLMKGRDIEFVDLVLLLALWPLVIIWLVNDNFYDILEWQPFKKKGNK